MENNTKSPLKDRPLRLPGQSLDEEIKRLMGDGVLPYILLPVVLILLTVWNWLLWYQIVAIHKPVLLTILTAFLLGFSFLKLREYKKQIRNLKQGMEGERAVGQTLESLRSSGFKVFHDLIGEGFNLDHVIVGEQGVFSLETKTYSKPVKGVCRIIVDSDGFSINGQKIGEGILVQAKAQKSWLEKQVARLSGEKVSVQPVVLFPGWYVENKRQSDGILVLEPKALPAFIRKRPKVLSKRQVKIISNHLSRFIRDTYDATA